MVTFIELELFLIELFFSSSHIKTNIPQQNINELQSEVKKIDACMSFQAEEIRNNRKQLIYYSKCMTDVRCINFIRNSFLLQTTLHNVKTVSCFPFMNPNCFTVSERLIEMSGIGYIRTEISRFLQPLFKLGRKIPTFFSNITNEHFDECLEKTNFIPKGINPRQFFACSTFPSLFSYCWTTELQTSYINTLFEIAKNSIESIKSEGNEKIKTFLQQHWIFECIRSYVFSSDIQNFLRVSIGDILVNVPQPQSFPASQSYCDVLFNGLNLTFDQMIQNMSLFPKDVRLLFKKFAGLVSETDEEQKILFVDLIFVECIIKPVASNIIVFTSPRNKGKTFITNKGLEIILQLWKLILNEKMVEDNSLFKDVNFSHLHRDSLVKFYTALVSIDDTVESINTPSLVQFMNIIDIQFSTCLFSLPDVFLLAYLITKVTPSDDRLIYPAANALINKVKEPDFRFFRHETWDFELYGIQKPEPSMLAKPDVKDSKSISSSQANSIRHCAISLFKYLSVTDFNVDAPSTSLTEFLTFRDIEATLSDDTKVKCYLWNLRDKMQNANASESEIVSALVKEISDQEQCISKNNSLITELTMMSHLLCKQSKRFQKKLDDLMILIYNVLLDLFFFENQSVIHTIESNSRVFLKDKIQFDAFFNQTIQIISSFLDPFASFAIQGVATQFHLRLMTFLSFGLFFDLHPRYEVNDDLFRNVQQSKIESICSLSETESISNLLNYVIYLFRLAIKVEIPIIAMNYIVKGCKQLDRITSIYHWNSNYVKKLVCFAILKMNRNNVFSFNKFLEFALKGLSINGIPLFSEKKMQKLNFFLQTIKELDIILCETNDKE